MEVQIKCLSRPSEEIIKKYVEVVNKAFLNRKNIKNINPYTVLDFKDISNEITDKDILAVVYNQKNTIIGGAIIKRLDHLNGASLHHVCIEPQYQGNGYAKQLMQEIKRWIKDANMDVIELTVGSIWKETIGLYKSVGFKISKVEAHLPGTYFLVHMKLYIKSVNTIGLKFTFIKSYLIFKLLYTQDSRPTWVCKALKKYKILN